VLGIFGIDIKRSYRQKAVRWLLTVLLVVGLGVGSMSCSQPTGSTPSGKPKPPSRLSEVGPPATIQELRQVLDVHQPQVTILSPRADVVLQDTTVAVQLRVNDLPLFKNAELGLGPHLHFILDNQPYEAIYDVSKPVLLEDLTPGTHTIRVFASRPWHESFKNEGAFAQTTFHIFAKTPENSPDPDQPLLTYSRPKGEYGAEPIMLDFYLTNVPLHLVAQENADDNIPDWTIRCTINGESFTFDRWEPIYLKGLKPGRSWVQLELLDEQGNPYTDAFNNTVRLIDYNPGGTDALSKLIRGDLTLSEAMYIVDPNYVPPAPEPEPEPEVPIVPLQEASPGEIPEVLPDEAIDGSTLPELAPLEPSPAEEAPAALNMPDETTQTDRPFSREEAAAVERIPPSAIAPGLTEPAEPEPTEPTEVNNSTVKKQLTQEVEEQIEDLDLSLPKLDLNPVTIPTAADEANVETVPEAQQHVMPQEGVPPVSVEPAPAPDQRDQDPGDEKLLVRARRFLNRLVPAAKPEVTSSPASPAIDSVGE
jgi:hypothetical protein